MKTMASFTPCKLLVILLAGALVGGAVAAWSWWAPAADTAADEAPQSAVTPPDGWTTAAPRDEIRPEFAYDPKDGPDGKGCFLIKADQRAGLAGCWKKTFPVTGRKQYHFKAS